MGGVPLGPGGSRRRVSGHSSAAGSQGILLPREGKEKSKGLKLCFPPKGWVCELRPSEEHIAANLTPTRCHEVYGLRPPRRYEGILMAWGPLELGWGATFMDTSPAFSTWSTNQEQLGGQ